MFSNTKEFKFTYDEYVKIVRLIENLRISLDRIGAINKQGRDKMLLAADEYFSDHEQYKIYEQIKDCAMILLPKVDSEEWRVISKGIKYFELKKYD